MTRLKPLSSLLLTVCITLPVTGAILCPNTCLAEMAQSSGASPSVAYQVRTLTAAQATQDVALLRRGLETIHPGLYRRATKAQMDRAFSDLEAAAGKPISELEFYRRISLVLADIRCNHTKAEQTPGIEAWRRDNPSHLPFRFRLLEGRMIVDSSDPSQTPIPKGTEIVSINGRSVASMVRTLGAYVPIDGDTIWARPTNLSSDGDLMGSDFDHFYPYVYGFETSYNLVVRDAGNRDTRTIKLGPMTFRAWRVMSWDGDGFRSDFGKTTSWRMLDDKTAYLRVITFVNYRNPVDPPSFYNTIFAAIKQEGATRLILDLRDNGGGSGDATYPLADFLTQRPFVWNAAIRNKVIRYGDLQNSIDTWGDPQENFFSPLDHYNQVSGGFEMLPPQSPEELMPRTPSPNAFTGPVTILTSPVNGSGSTMLIAKLRDEGRVRLIGGRSGGSGDGPTAGRIFNVKLPNSGIAIRVPNAFNQMQVTRFEPKGGIIPDRLVEQSVADFRARRDTVLQAALSEVPLERKGPTVPDARSFTARLSGQWVGTLEYRDYQSNGRVTLPTELTITQSNDKQSANLAYVYDDGPSKTVRSSASWSLDASQSILSKVNSDGSDLYRAIGNLNPALGQPLALTLWGRGTENGAAVDVRETLEVSQSRIRILRETRLKGQGPYEFRHEYQLTKR